MPLDWSFEAGLRASLLQVQVRFVDFGNVETVSGKDVRPLREEFAREPACVLPVVLAGVARLAPNAVDLLPAEVLTVEPTDNASPPSVRLMHAGTCINDRVASQPVRPRRPSFFADYRNEPGAFSFKFRHSR